MTILRSRGRSSEPSGPPSRPPEGPPRRPSRRGARLLRILLAGALLFVLAAGAGAGALYLAFFRDLPDLRSVEDYRPPLASVVLDREGRPIGHFYRERRRLVAIDEIPRHTKLAFVAGEDKSFFEHKGIDYVSILRAAWANLRAGGEIRQGASTITQQMVKSLLLSPERTFQRKFREMILAREIEQHFTKEEILYLYLNQIYFGHGAWGIGEAARDYFGKEVSELDVSESALLAGLPQRPSAYSPFVNPEAAEARRRYVLGRMLDDGAIDEPTYEEALASPPALRDPDADDDLAVAAYFTEEVRRHLFDEFGGDRVLEGGLVVETTLDLDLQRGAVRALRKGLEDHDRRQGYRGPLRHVERDEIEAEILQVAEENELLPEEDEETDSEAAAPAAEPATPSEEPGAARAADRLAGSEPAAADGGTGEAEEAVAEAPAPELPMDERLLGVVTDVDTKARTARVAFAPGIAGEVRVEDVAWAREPDPEHRGRPVQRIEKVFRVGDVARFSRLPDEEEDAGASEEAADAAPPLPRLALEQEPLVEGALLSLEVDDGDVLALVGGYDFARSEFNRVTQGRRQPGSAFKPIIYGAALSRDYTPVSTLWDRPAVYEDPVSGFVWRPQNYGRQFYGPLPLRTALVRSVNNATVHLFRDVGVDYVINFARRLGIRAPLRRDLSLALGSSSISLLELTRAYAVFPNGGRRVTPRFIRRVTDRDGRVLLENVALLENEPEEASETPDVAAAAEDGPEDEAAEAEPDDPDQLIPEAVAYLMCDLLKGVVNDPHGTGWRLRQLERPVAGKTGTTNDQADAWFMGFSPDVATGVWVGHDESRVLGRGETGSRAAAPIWVDYMRLALRDRPVHDFDVPDGIVFQRIDRQTGLLADAGSADAYFQPFLEGTAPSEKSATASFSADTRRALREDAF